MEEVCQQPLQKKFATPGIYQRLWFFHCTTLPICLAQIPSLCLMLQGTYAFSLKNHSKCRGSKMRDSCDAGHKILTNYFNFVTFPSVLSLQNTLLKQEKINLRVE